MNTLQIEDKIKSILEKIDKSSFIYDLLGIYDFPKSTIAKLKKDPTKNTTNENQVILKNKFIFQTLKDGEDVHAIIDSLSKDVILNKFTPRFLIVTDFETLLAKDTKTKETLDIEIKNLSKHYVFFLPWIGMEKAIYVAENPADIKASYKMAKLYDQIISDNANFLKYDIHDLNIFLSRLLFCFFSEDTGIFQDDIFTYFLKSYTKQDGSDLSESFKILFEVLNAKDTKSFAEHYQKFPYVNGGLFENKIKLPLFTKKSRDMIIECADMNWAEINPDIFGSMIQAVVNPDQRENLGMHYTSVPNIMKVIEPLFLNDLNDEFFKNYDDDKKLDKLWKRLGEINIFDPACGSGNFLIISFKEMCKLEMKILERIQNIKGQATLKMGNFSIIKLSQFYGIEIDDFAHEMAILSLWLAQHQMNNKFKEIFGQSNPTLPLREGGNIECGNATRLDWKKVCPKVDKANNLKEIYIAGNPPYLGSRNQKEEQKKDMEVLFEKDYKSLDYISCWFYKGAEYINGSDKIKLAFVSTNSICQGEQVALLWPKVFKNNVEIFFAYLSFKWKNLAKGNAGVTCIIVGLSSLNDRQKYLYLESKILKVKKINSYLTEGDNIYIERRPEPISELPHISFGNMPNDGGHLLLDNKDYTDLINLFPNAKVLIKKVTGSNEFINNINRFCLWLSDSDINLIENIPPIKKRIEQVKIHRLSSDDKGTNKLARRSHQFRDRNVTKQISIIIPSVSSERREYIPIGFVDKNTIVTNSAQVIYDSEPYVFGIITSRMHMVWVRAVSGRLKTDLRYSAEISYNTFPLPKLTQTQKDQIENNVRNILDERERYPEKTMAELYNPDKMPDGLREAHQYLDELVDKIYRQKPFENDEERLAHLFRLYEEMINRDKLIKDESSFIKKKRLKTKTLK